MNSLHLGSGLDYRTGGLNIDRYDLTSADLQADALRLPLADASMTHIEARHLVEHLGHAGTIYALAEWLRVLAPGGTLLIETPDRIAACQAAAVTAPQASSIHWLFGLPWAGYGHRTLFDEQELRTLAKQARWAGIESTQLDASDTEDTNLPASLRLTARKPLDPLAELRARLHIGFVQAGIVDPVTAPPHLAHLEGICDSIVSAIEECAPQNSRACLARVLGATARYTPLLTCAVLETLVSLGYVSEQEADPFSSLARSLASVDFPARMTACLRQIPALAGTQSTRIRRLYDRTSLYLTGLLHPGESALLSAIEWFDADQAEPNTTDSEIRFFCPETVAGLSRRETARGVRAFANGQFDAARVQLEAAILYNADNPLPLWNLARLNLRGGKRLKALESYAALLELLPDAADLFRGEMDAVTERSTARLTSIMEPVQLPGLKEMQARTLEKKLCP